MNEKNNIPKHWQIKKLGEVCFTTSGGTPRRGNKRFYEGNIPWVKSGELSKGLITDTEEKISEEAIKNSSAKIFPKGTLLIALYGATIGKLAFLGVDAATNQAVCGIYKNENIDSNYLYYYLFSKKPSLVKQGIGGAQPNISQGILKNLDLPLPPLSEQQAIVSKIEELLSDLENGKQQLLLAQQQIKIYRQSLLKAAFEGKLTNKNVKDGELPKGWIENEIKKVCSNIKVGIVIRPTNFYSKNGKGIKAFRSANVRELKINDTDWVYFSEEANEMNHRTKLKSGDVLLVRSGYPGTSCVVSNEFDGCNAIDILIATPNKEKILSEYLCYFNNSPLGKGLFISKSRGVAQKHLNVGEYSKLKIYIPSLKEQQLIVDELESKLTVCDKIEETISQSLLQAESLRQSILKKAFEGKLHLNHLKEQELSLAAEPEIDYRKK